MVVWCLLSVDTDEKITATDVMPSFEIIVCIIVTIVIPHYVKVSYDYCYGSNVHQCGEIF